MDRTRKSSSQRVNSVLAAGRGVCACAALRLSMRGSQACAPRAARTWWLGFEYRLPPPEMQAYKIIPKRPYA